MTPGASAAVALVAGTVTAAAIVLAMPAVAERLIPAGASAPTAETLFNAAVFGVLLAAGALGGALFAVNALAPGVRPLAMMVAGGFVGVSGMLLAAALAAMTGMLQVGAGARPAGGGVLLWGAAVVLMQAAAEEVYFRGWLQPMAVRGWGVPAGVVAASLAFTLLHVVGGARAPLSMVNLFLGGALFGVIAVLGRGIAGAVAAHGAWNGAEQLLLGLDPNPGVGGFGAAMDFDLVGAGAEEGLNASLAMTLVLLALLVPAALMLRRKGAA